MQAVELFDDLDEALPLQSRHAKQVHGGIVQTYQREDHYSLLGLQILRMGRSRSAETSTPQVEKAVWRIVGKVGTETQKLREFHHEYNVEVGKLSRAMIQPHQAVGDIVEQHLVALLPLEGMCQKLRDK